MNKEKSIITSDIHEGYYIIDFQRADDERGCLCIADEKNLPFNVKRVFWIHGVKNGMCRGSHAHRTCAELIIPVSGSFDITVDNGKENTIFTMDKPYKGIYIGPNVWCNLYNFSDNAVCVVLASQEYDAKGYINDYETFKRMIEGEETDKNICNQTK